MNNNKEIEKLSHSEISNILIKARVQSRWKNAFEKIKNKQFLFNEENKKFLSMAYTRNLTTKVKPSLEQNSIAQKFTAMLKKKFKFLSIKQYKMINDICYADVEEHIKKRQKLKKALMMNYMGNSDKKARINIVFLFFLQNYLYFILFL